MKLSNIELNHTRDFRIPLPDGSISFGNNQEWYPTEWQVRSGCGPSTAANMFAYLSIDAPDDLAPAEIRPPYTKKSMLDLMEIVWNYVTPTNRGVNSNAIFTKGVDRYARERNLPITCHSLPVPHRAFRRAKFREEFLAFIHEGLMQECPLAFLNLSNGALDNLHHWHWVTLFSLTEKDGHYYSIASDEGDQKMLNMSKWVETSTLGGGLVYLTLE